VRAKQLLGTFLALSRGDELKEESDDQAVCITAALTSTAALANTTQEIIPKKGRDLLLLSSSDKSHLVPIQQIRIFATDWQKNRFYLSQKISRDDDTFFGTLRFSALSSGHT